MTWEQFSQMAVIAILVIGTIFLVVSILRNLSTPKHEKHDWVTHPFGDQTPYCRRCGTLKSSVTLNEECPGGGIA